MFQSSCIIRQVTESSFESILTFIEYIFLPVDEIVWRKYDRYDGHLRRDRYVKRTFLERQQIGQVFVSCSFRKQPDFSL